MTRRNIKFNFKFNVYESVHHNNILVHNSKYMHYLFKHFITMEISSRNEAQVNKTRYYN
jgi:hypothetical protein